MLANHDQNVLVLFRLAQSMCLYVKLESSYYKIYCVNLPGSIDRELDSIDRKSCRLFFFFVCRISNLVQARLTCSVLCFVLSIKGKTLATFWGCSLCCVYESSVRSRGICLHTHLGFPISRLMLRAWWSIQLLFQKLKVITSGSACTCWESKKEVVHRLRAVTWSW